MTTSKIDKILATEEELIPSSGFLSTVMERVNEEAAALPPIPFPWKRAIPGILLATIVFGWGIFELIRRGIPAAARSSLSMPHLDALSSNHLNASIGRPLESIGWVALAAAVSLASWLFSRKLAGRSGLM
jgi:hypothetical protein